MKIAIVTHYFLPKYLAGTEIATLNIAHHLVQKGHEVHIITWLDEGQPKKSMQDGVYIHRVYGKNIRFFSHILFWLKILMTLRIIKPDIVHIQNINLGVPGFLSKTFLKIPYLIYERGFENLNPKSFIKKIILKLGLNSADKVIALTQEMKKDLETIYKKEILIVPNGIDFGRFDIEPKDERTIINKKTIIYIGRLIPIKGVEYLIKAMAIIQKQDENISLIVIGDGSQREFLKDLVKKLDLENRITFKGKIPYDDIPKSLHQADVFVLPSVSEGFPNVILEAMAAGLPIISTNVKGLSEIVKNNENGYLVEPGNPEQLAEKILVLLKNMDICKTMSQNNIKKAKTYSWESVAGNLETIYTSILSTDHGGK